MTRDLQQAIAASGLRSGGTVSFHHHLRNGDAVVVAALDACADLGLTGLHIAPSSLFPCHAPLVERVRRGVIGSVSTAYMNGPFADAITTGALNGPVTLQTHGGRARRIVSGEMPIDLAIIAAPAVDPQGNVGGADGPNACGPLGYAMVDAAHARHVLAVTDAPRQPLRRICVPVQQITESVRIPTIGDARLLQSGTTARTPGPEAQAIADLTLGLIAASGLVRDGFNFQAGAGATALATARQVAQLMAQTGARGDFIAGGITGASIDMFKAGLFRRLMNVQSFDRAAVDDYATNPGHHAMSASAYANPDYPDPVAHRLDVMLLGAAEVDRDFNVNATTTSDGRIIGGSGGHADTAEGAKLAIVTMPLRSGDIARVVPHVRCVTTPGNTIDALVTEAGIAINPARPDLKQDAKRAGLALVEIADLCRLAGGMPHHKTEGPVVAQIEHRDGRILDEVHAPAVDGPSPEG